MKRLAIIFIFFTKVCMGGGYIESIVVDGATTNATAESNGKYSVSYTHGSASYRYNIFYSACGSGVNVPYSYSYISLPLKIGFGNSIIDINWSANTAGVVVGDSFVVYNKKATPGKCSPSGRSGRSSPAAELVVTGVANVANLLSPGTVKLSDITYYVGNVFGDSESEALSILRQYHNKGTPTKRTPNGNGILTIPYQCKLANGLDNIDIYMGEVSLGAKKSKSAKYTINCNAEYAALNAMNFKLYGQGSREISSSPDRQMIKIELSNGSTGEVNITPQLSGNNVELSMDFVLDASLGKEGSADGSVVLRYEFN